MQELPIVYCRGYAGPTSQIDSTVNDPFYGFNEGATHTRVNGDGDPMFYQFEGPLLRLLGERAYQVLVRGSQKELLATAADGSLPQKSIWIHRFYDEAATTYAAPTPRSGNLFDRAITWTEDLVREHTQAQGFDIEQAARELYDLVLMVREKTGAPKVFLVAHSMGGLVARCMMQKVCEEDGRIPAKELVAKFCTYATPHGGIVFTGGLLNWLMETFGPAGSDIFSPPKMYGYLTPGKKFGDKPIGVAWDPRVIPPSVFDVDDVFCIIGTDQNDYNLAKLGVGPRSDGLVLIENAYVKGAHRAFVYKSHSGPYGEVNSEEGYQNLARFLFGHWSVQVELSKLPPASVIAAQPDVAWQADLQLAIRGLSVLITEQKAVHYNPVQLNAEIAQHAPGAAGEDSVDAPIPLVGTFLFSKEPPGDLPPTHVTPGVGDDPTPGVAAAGASEVEVAAAPAEPPHRSWWHRFLDSFDGGAEEQGQQAPSSEPENVALDNPLDPTLPAVAAAAVASYAQLSQDLSRYALTLRVYQVITRNGVFDFSSNLEQVGDWQDVLIVDIGRAADGRFGAWTGWNSAVPGAINQLGQMADELTLTPDPHDRNVIRAVLDLPPAARALPIFGPAAQLAFTIVNRDA
ncbi:esterase/lipase family protein [Leifsonia shinshuensis]|uniref:Alpha/beta hydrolase n=1 Tax=Leifsonia shinshuensis TaxID=150026 RepID=A0A7G6Y8V2_9MICO|nr:alpha/beta hydrolase [Leifsonia shinshuensis]QNE34917.1 alpha/beta hydrolase [Leifsonia shinshuensis]